MYCFWTLSKILALCGNELEKNYHFCSDDFGEFVAEMVVVVDKEEHDAKNNGDMTVKKALEDTARGGRLGALKVDPESLTLREPGITLYYLNFYTCSL